MLRNAVCPSLVVLIFALWPAVPTAAVFDKDVAFVDMRRIFDFYVRTQNVEDGLGQIQKTALAEASRKRKRLDDLKERLRKISEKKEPDPQAANLAEEIRFLEDELARFLADKKNEIRLQEKNISRSLLRSIHEQVKKIAAQEHFYLVLEKSQYALYVSTRADITDKVIRNLERDRDLFKLK